MEGNIDEKEKPSTRRTRGCHLTGKAHAPPQTRESRKRGLSVALARLLLFLGLEGSSFTHSLTDLLLIDF